MANAAVHGRPRKAVLRKKRELFAVAQAFLLAQSGMANKNVCPTINSLVFTKTGNMPNDVADGNDADRPALIDNWKVPVAADVHFLQSIRD